MTWALVGILVLVVIVALCVGFLALQSVSQTLSNAILTLERVHANDGKRIDKVLDRLMAKDFESFKSYDLAEQAEEGGMEFPEEGEPEARIEIPGITHAMGFNDLEREAAERRIILEDFPAEESVV